MNYTVYMHIFPNSKKYVGITCCATKKRWNGGRGYQSQKLMNRAILKYGWDNVDHIILYENIDELSAKIIEKELIKKYDLTNQKFGYNVSIGGDSGNGLKGEKHPLYGKHHSKETKEKISNSNIGKTPWNKGIVGGTSSFKGKKHTEENKKKLSEYAKLRTGYNATTARSVVCVTTGEVFPSATYASIKYNCCQSNITYCCMGKRHYACKLEDGTKLKWIYYDEFVKLSN